MVPAPASAQVGVIEGPANSLLSCIAFAAGTPEIRPEGYTELLGDVLISCTGGPLLQVGADVPTANIVVYILPAIPITSRLLGSGPSGTSEAILIVDEAGSSLTTGATGGYGPQAPQSLCTSAQQKSPDFPCLANAGLDNSGQYLVSLVPGTTTPAQNVFQGEVGDFGANSVTFYNVPVLPPARLGVSRTFRITNIRVPAIGGNLNTVSAVLSVSPNQVLPVAGTTVNIGVVGNSIAASVNAAPAGGGNPFLACIPQTSPTLAAQITFTEGFATGFKTRVVPGGAANVPFNNTGNTTWAAEAQNLVSPNNQNIPGGLYDGWGSNSESGFILPAAAFTDSTSNITYTAGLADYGTRLKAVFTPVIPGAMTLYVSTTNVPSYAIPGGTNTAPYAVLIADGQSNDANNDGATFTPLAATGTGSDGLGMYPLTTNNNTGTAAAIWEVVNADPVAIDNLTFSVYLAYNSFSASLPNWAINAALSYAPEPGGGSFSQPNAFELDNPLPRFGILQSQGGTSASFNLCGLSANTSSVPFTYSIGGSAPPSQNVPVTANPSNPSVTLTPTVTTPSGGNWLSASLSVSTLTVSANPAGLAASPTPYSGSVKLSALGYTDSVVPVTLTVSSPAQLSIVKSHSGDFVPGQLGATYTITVSNGASAGPTTGTVTVTETPPGGMSVVSMTSTGSVWTCTTSSCMTNSSIAGGGSYPPITVTVNVSSGATSPLANMASVTGGGSSTSPSYSDSTAITPFTCVVTGGQTPGVADVQSFINQALGISPPSFDLNSDGVVDVSDVQIVINSVIGLGCQ